MPNDLSKLQELAEGGRILNVLPPDAKQEEALFKLVVEKNGARHLFHVHATDLGWWVGDVQTRKVKEKS